MTIVMFEGKRFELHARWSVEVIAALKHFACLWCRTKTPTYGRCDNCGDPKPTAEHVL